MNPKKRSSHDLFADAIGCIREAQDLLRRARDRADNVSDASLAFVALEKIDALVDSLERDRGMLDNRADIL
jgi:hypothetical protein